MDYTPRLARLRARMQSTQTDMVVLGPSSHMLWLSGSARMATSGRCCWW